MAYLADTSVLLRLANQSDAQYPVADRAISALFLRGETVHIAPQILVEFRNVATRPSTVNGLGLSAAEAEVISDGYEAVFALLPETPVIFPAWKSLVRAAGVLGKQVHDARLVATCHAYAVTHVLTFNVQHFARFAAYGPGLSVVDPGSL